MDEDYKSDIPFSIAALPDLMASEAMLAMTSGRASKMMSRTPMGHVTLVRSSPSSSRVRKVTFPTFNQEVSLEAGCTGKIEAPL
jgi:hypothetical protein